LLATECYLLAKLTVEMVLFISTQQQLAALTGLGYGNEP